MKNQTDKRIAEVATNRWPELLPQLGIDSRYLVNRHGPCPSCGGRDRFRFDNKDGKGTFICNACGSGDGFTLVQLVTGKTFSQVAQMVSNITGEHPCMIHKDKSEDVQRRERIKQVWEGAKAPSPGGPVLAYMKDRLGLVWASNSIREFKGRNHWLMVSKIIGADNTAQNVHLTYLTDDGKKADVTPNRIVMSGPLPDGSAIRLAPAGVHMGIAEGIETAIAASVMFGIPVWSAVNAQNMAKWIPPEITERVTIFGDNDKSFTGHAASYLLAKNLTLRHHVSAQVMIPPVVGQDWADVLATASKGLIQR